MNHGFKMEYNKINHHYFKMYFLELKNNNNKINQHYNLRFKNNKKHT